MSRQRLWTYSELAEKRSERVRVTEEGTTCEVRCIRELQAIGTGMAHCAAFHLSHSHSQISTSLITKLMHELENNWSLCEIAPERGRVLRHTAAAVDVLVLPYTQ